MTKEYMLTTIDNPFDPFEQFTSWRLFDLEKGYNSCERLARLVNITDDMSEEEVNREIERAIEGIIKHDFLNIFKKAERNTKTSEQKEENDANNKQNIEQ